MKKFLILGGSSGIGKSIANLCLERSNEVIITGRDEKKLSKSVNDLAKIGKVSSLNLDLGNPKDVENKFINFINRYKNINGLIINGPLPPLKSFESCSLNDWQYFTNAIIISSVLIIKQLLPIMNKNSSIIFILSDTCRAAGANKSMSVSLRLALSGLVKSLAIEYADKGIKFNAVSPGPTFTDRAKLLFEKGAEKNGISFEDFKEDFINTLPSKRLIEPEEIADLVYYLLTNNSSSLNGINIPFDGGLTTMPF
jgi:NAD(P)-dependent dehydrogenase (short-subunit alcohol dehydrogenase family)